MTLGCDNRATVRTAVAAAAALVVAGAATVATSFAVGGGLTAGAAPRPSTFLRSTAQPASLGGTSGIQGASSGVCLAAAAAAAAAAVASATARRQARRDLSIAYEDSGIELLDNGKFAQGLVGADGAWGRYEFDPVGFSKATELVPFYREAELKHGRIAMLAWVGLVLPDFVRVPGERYSFEEVPRVIDAHDALNSSVGVNFQVIFWISILELCCAKKVFEWNSLEVAGDYGLTQFFPTDEEGQKRMRTAEIKNARLAMVAFSGAITQSVITSKPFPWLFEANPFPWQY